MHYITAFKLTKEFKALTEEEEVLTLQLTAN